MAVGWSSNLGFSSDASAQGLKPGFIHNHTISVAGGSGGNSYRVSAFFRSRSGTLPRDKDLGGGLNINFDAKANKTIWFGLKSIISIGDSNAQSGTAWYGHESATQLLRKTGSVGGFATDYDDNSRNYRTVNTAYLQVNFLKNLHWHTDLGIDYQYDTRYIWYGSGTQFGALSNGAAAILTSSMLEYRFGTKLDYDLYLKKHHLSAMAGFNAYGSNDKLGTMNGRDFFNHELRAKGLRFNGEKPQLYQFDDKFNHIGISADVRYSYDGIAELDLAFGMDKATVYDDGNFSLYPAATLRLDLHKLLIPDFKAVSTLSLDGGYGRSGRDSFCPCEMFPQYYPDITISDFQEGTESIYDGLCRTRVSEWHAGGRVGFVSDRILLGLSWYDRNVTDSFCWYRFGADSGKNNRWKPSDRVDLGSVDNILSGRGLEVDLGAVIIDNGAAKWTADVNLTYQQTTSSRYENVDLNLFPTLFGGLSTRLSVSRFTVDAALDGSYGNELLNMNRMLDEHCPTPDSGYVERADFLRIGKLGLSYDIPLSVKWIKGLRVYAEGLNLATFSPYSGFNPDVDSYAKISLYRGDDYASFPLMRSFMFGVKLNF